MVNRAATDDILAVQKSIKNRSLWLRVSGDIKVKTHVHSDAPAHHNSQYFSRTEARLPLRF